MERIRFPGGVFRWDFPEKQWSIPGYLRDAGRAKVIKRGPNSLNVEIELEHPAIVFKERPPDRRAKGVLVNTITRQLIVFGGPDIKVAVLPEPGDLTVTLIIWLYLLRAQSSHGPTPHSLALFFEDVGKKIAAGWHYWWEEY